MGLGGNPRGRRAKLHLPIVAGSRWGTIEPAVRAAAVRAWHCYDGGVNLTAKFKGIWREVRTVFLDRDGVLNRKMPEGEYVTRWEEFEVLPGVPGAVARLNRAGLRVIVVSNQRGIARGRYAIADVEAMHARFQDLLKQHGAHIDAFFICPHDEGQCDCRKPSTGLFRQAVAQFPDIEAESSIMIGDSPADMNFGRALGMKTILIEGEPQQSGFGGVGEGAGLFFNSLADAVEALLAPPGA